MQKERRRELKVLMGTRWSHGISVAFSLLLPPPPSLSSTHLPIAAFSAVDRLLKTFDGGGDA